MAQGLLLARMEKTGLASQGGEAAKLGRLGRRGLDHAHRAATL